MSLDGYIADADGDVHWLEAFEKDDYGYGEFIESVGSILMGRVTYDQVLSFGVWPYKDIPTLVWSGSKVEDLPGGARIGSDNFEETDDWLKTQAGDKDVWILGGARTIQPFLANGMIDRMELFIIPVLLGGGIRLFDGEDSEPAMLKLENSQPFISGVVHLIYSKR